MAVDESAGWDATEMAAAIRSGAVSALEMADAAIARAEALNPALNFLVAEDFERARERARAPLGEGPFAGVPYLIKDLDDMVGLPTRLGSRSTAGLGAATRQSPLIAGMLAAGLNPIGKSSTPEHGFLPTTEPLAFGPTRNPWDPTRSSGGSSGGAGAATAAHVVPFAHASDGGGSIRIPASCCGLFGLKTSRGRTLATDPGHFPLPLSVQLCVSRSVRDTAALLAAVEAHDSGLPPVGLVKGPSAKRLRVGLVIDSVAGGAPDPEVAAAVQGMAALLGDLGHHVAPTAWPAAIAGMGDPFLLTWSKGAANLMAETAARLGHAPTPDEVEPFSLAMASIVAMAPDGAVEQAVAYLEGLDAPYAAWLVDYDVILSPVLALPPVELGWLAPDLPVETMAERLPAYVGYTTPANVVGAPAMSMPGAWSAAGLPIGAQFQAAVGDEATLLALAYEIEAARPLGREAAGDLRVRWARIAVVWGGGLGLAALAQYWAFGIGGGGDGWITPFFLSPLLFVLNPVAFDLVLRERRRTRVAATLLAVALVADLSLVFVTDSYEAAYFWSNNALLWNLGWLSLWSLWQIAALLGMFHMRPRAADIL